MFNRQAKMYKVEQGKFKQVDFEKLDIYKPKHSYLFLLPFVKTNQNKLKYLGIKSNPQSK